MVKEAWCFGAGSVGWDGMGWDVYVCVRERNDRLVGRLNERRGGRI